MKSKKMTVNVISESKYSPDFFGGLHTAFLNHVDLLRKANVDIKINALGKSDITHIHSYGLFAMYKLLSSKRTVVSSHLIPATMVGTFKGNKYWGGMFKNYLKFFYNNADLIIILRKQIGEELKNIGVTQKMVVISNPIDTSRFRPDKNLRKEGRKRLGIKNDAVVILGAGHLTQRKGINDFIALAKELPAYTFVWVGGNSTGLLHSGIKKEFLRNLPANIRLTGSFAYNTMPEIFNLADIFLFPSFQEIASMAILEAAACGLPLVLRDLPEYKQLYEDGYIACKNNAAFKAGIMKLTSNKKFYAQRVEASTNVAKKFSLENLQAMFLKEYTTLFENSTASNMKITK